MRLLADDHPEHPACGCARCAAIRAHRTTRRTNHRGQPFDRIRAAIVAAGCTRPLERIPIINEDAHGIEYHARIVFARELSQAEQQQRITQITEALRGVIVVTRTETRPPLASQYAPLHLVFFWIVARTDA